MAVAYLEKKRPGKNWLDGKITTRQYIEELSNEWGAFRSYSGNVLPGNSGKIGPEKIEAALNKVKKGGYSQEEISIASSAGGTGGSYTQLSNNPDATRGSKLAGELGRFLDSKGLGKWGSGVHQHPEHRPWSPESGHSVGSLHYASKGGRAIDIGGYGKSKGYSDQDQIIAGVAEFNKMKGVKPVQLLKDGYPGHSDHVHVAYQKGGPISRPTHAYLGERGKEFILDYNTTINSPPGFLEALNTANTKQGVMYTIQKYASYNQPYGGEPQIVEVPVYVPMPGGGGGGGGRIPIPIPSGVNSNNQFDCLSIG
jgi:hypothetical protein